MKSQSPYVQKRDSGRFTGYYYDPSGNARSAGTYDTYDEALFRAKDAQAGRFHVPTQKNSLAIPYQDYVTEWLKTARVLDTTKKSYDIVIHKHVIPRLGHLPVESIDRERIQEVVDALLAEGVHPVVVARAKAAVGSSFKPLVPGRIKFNPTHGVVVEVPPTKEYRWLETDEFKQVAERLPSKGTWLFAVFLVTSGCRFGEATELRVHDFDFKNNEVTIARRVLDVGAKRNDGARYKVVSGTKAGQSLSRTVVIPAGVMDLVKAWIGDNGLAHDNLVFPQDLLIGPLRNPTDRVDTSLLGERWRSGDRTYIHGTLYSYADGGCRCGACREARRVYRMKRANLDQRKRLYACNTTGHLTREDWRDTWQAAVRAANLGWMPRTHDLRHANATELVAQGISLFEVMQRLGHKRIDTTLKYQHRVDRQKSKAADAVAGYVPNEAPQNKEES